MEKYFKTKYRAAGLLLTVNTTIYFKFKSQLKFRNNKNYSSIIINFHSGTYMNLKLKFSMNENCHEKTSHWYTVTVLLLKPYTHSLISITSFRLSKLLYS
jgi:hypothetical protein